jgi:sodium transport system permease protein
MLRSALVVMRKALTETVRDRRSLASALLYAVWGPAVMTMALMALARDRAPDQPLTLAVLGAGQVEALTAFLREKRVTVVDAPRDLRARVQAREWPVGLIVSDAFVSRLADTRPALLTVIYDSTIGASNRQAARVKGLLSEYGKRIADTRLILRGIAPETASPLRVAEEDLSTATSRAASLLGTLPIFLLVAAFVGGMGLAADEMAGERERRSLESLLTYPIRRSAIVAGKWGAASLLVLVTLTLTIVSASALLQHPRVQVMDLPVGISLSDGVIMWFVIAPLAVLVTAVQLLISLFARTYKEAQTQLSLLMFLPMIPGFLFAFGSIEIRPWMAMTPVLAQQIMLTGVLRGDAPPLVSLGLVSVITLALGMMVALVTARLLEHESIVRRLG